MSLKILKEFDKLTPIEREKLKAIKAGFEDLEFERRKKILTDNN